MTLPVLSGSRHYPGDACLDHPSENVTHLSFVDGPSYTINTTLTKQDLTWLCPLLDRVSDEGATYGAQWMRRQIKAILGVPA